MAAGALSLTINMRSIQYRLALLVALAISTLSFYGPYGSTGEDHADWVRLHYDKNEKGPVHLNR